VGDNGNIKEDTQEYRDLRELLGVLFLPSSLGS
jgi:hypothetical protein